MKATYIERVRQTYAWDANPSGDNVTKYSLYYGTATATYSTHVDITSGTTYKFTLTPKGYGTVYLALTATNAQGESEFSNEITS